MVVLGVGIGGMSRSRAGGCWVSLSSRRFLLRWQRAMGHVPAETKTKKAGAKGQGTSCLLTPAYAATDPPDAVAGLPLVSSSVVFVRGVCCGSRPRNTIPPNWVAVHRGRSLTQRWKYIAKSGARKKTAWTALSLRPRSGVVLDDLRSETVGDSRDPFNQTSAKKLANFTPAPLALMPTVPAAAITLSLTCTSSSRRK